MNRMMRILMLSSFLIFSFSIARAQISKLASNEELVTGLYGVEWGAPMATAKKLFDIQFQQEPEIRFDEEEEMHVWTYYDKAQVFDIDFNWVDFGFSLSKGNPFCGATFQTTFKTKAEAEIFHKKVMKCLSKHYSLTKVEEQDPNCTDSYIGGQLVPNGAVPAFTLYIEKVPIEETCYAVSLAYGIFYY